MKTLIFRHGIEGRRVGIEDGLSYLKRIEVIKEIKWFYFEEYFEKNGKENTLNIMEQLASEFQPEVIIFTHVARFPINKNFIGNLRNIGSNPIIAYDEGDMFGWTKTVTPSMKLLIKFADVVSVRGLGKWLRTLRRMNDNIVYIPNFNALVKYTENIVLSKKRKYKFVFVGNYVGKGLLGNITRMPGAKGREDFITQMSDKFSYEVVVYGNGWDHLKTNKGNLPFNDQVEVYSNSWFHITYEHYPKIPFSFSNRIPIALASGQICICNYHAGYEQIFKGCDFIYFYKSFNEAVNLIYYLFSLSEDELYNKSIRAKEFADTNFSPQIVWENYFNRLIELTSGREEYVL